MSTTSTEPRTRAHVGAVENFVLNEFQIFDLGRRHAVGVVSTAKGFYAARNHCPHQGASICSGRVGGSMVPSAPGQYAFSDDKLVVVCPWHRWEFELETGKSFGRVTHKKLVTYPVEVEDGQVYVIMRGERS